jgi:hypothetical protein
VSPAFPPLSVLKSSLPLPVPLLPH